VGGRFTPAAATSAAHTPAPIPAVPVPRSLICDVTQIPPLNLIVIIPGMNRQNKRTQFRRSDVYCRLLAESHASQFSLYFAFAGGGFGIGGSGRRG
jgi:hypothetical protein